MARYSKRERQEAADRLREWLKPGDTVYTVLRHCSRSGMLRVIGPVLLPTEEWSQVRHIGFLAAKVLDWPDDGDQGVKVSGCGMDMGFHLVYELSSVLFPEGFQCIGEGCPANDHSNARGAYCAVCGDSVGGSPPLPTILRGRHPVCSEACKSAPWVHRDGGYALNQRWL